MRLCPISAPYCSSFRQGDSTPVKRRARHPDRLLVLCELKGGEASVGELARRLGIKQSPLSQRLARMRHRGVVVARREAQTVYYRISDGKVAEVVSVLYTLYCSDDD